MRFCRYRSLTILRIDFTSLCLLIGCAFILFQLGVQPPGGQPFWGQPVWAQPIPENPSSGVPLIGRVTVLYDGTKTPGGPESQGFLTYGEFPPGAANVSSANDLTVLDTTANQSGSAGYGMDGTVPLDGLQGYALHLRTRVAAETHASQNRAGFSLTMLGSDRLGIELGFWGDQIWAQEGGTTDLFTRAEAVAFDTTAALTDYTVTIRNGSYALSAGATQILTGTVRDYSAFNGLPDPYETADFLFFGDNTSSAQAKVEIAAASLIVNEDFSDLNIRTGHPLTIANIGLMDANSSALTLTVSTSLGNLTVTTDVDGGVPMGSISGNGSSRMTMSGSVVALNRTLSTLTYLADFGITGADSLLLAVEDETALRSAKVININVTGGVAIVTSTPTTTLAPTLEPSSTPAPTATATQLPAPHTPTAAASLTPKPSDTPSLPTVTTTANPTAQPSATMMPTIAPTVTPTATAGGTMLLPGRRVFLPQVRR